MKRPTANSRRQRGFTLVEILVVIVILGLLATIVGPNIFKALTASEGKTAKLQVKALHSQVQHYVLNNSSLPDTLEVLLDKEEEDGRAYLDELPLDPWKNEYLLVPGETSREFEIISFGPDGEEGTEDDISSKSTRKR